jgi:hypothetical protein
MSANSENTTDQTAAFQKIWLESLSKMMQAVFTFGPDSTPPEVVREIRSGIFQALAKSWEEFMRSPQFLEGMKQWMDQAVTLRKMTNDFMATARSELQATSREDVDTIMLTVRHMEQRILDRVEDLSTELNELKQRLDGAPTPKPAAKAKADRVPRRKTPRRKR